MPEWIAARRGKSWLIGIEGGSTQLVISPPPGYPGAGDDLFDRQVTAAIAGLNEHLKPEVTA